MAWGVQSAKNTFELLNSNGVFPEIMTQLLKIIHRLCFEQFHIGKGASTHGGEACESAQCKH